MASARSGFGIRWLCAQCYEYYQNKSVSQGLGGGGATGEYSHFYSISSVAHCIFVDGVAFNSIPAAPDRSRIQQANAAGQRGGTVLIERI